MADKKYLDSDGLLYFYSGLKTKFVTDVIYNTTSHKFQKVKNGQTTDIVTASDLKTEMGLDNVGNFKAVSTVASQGLTETEKANARANIGAGDSAFSGSFNDLTDVPTTLSGYGITDANISNGVITLGSNTITPLTSHQDISGKADKATTLAGYGITDAYILNGVITLGANSVDVSGVYRYKGSVATYAALPTHSSTPPPQAGDVYNVESDGKNYAYVGYVSNEDVWDDIGGTFTITSITNAEIDTILAS